MTVGALCDALAHTLPDGSDGRQFVLATMFNYYIARVPLRSEYVDALDPSATLAVFDLTPSLVDGGLVGCFVGSGGNEEICRVPPDSDWNAFDVMVRHVRIAERTRSNDLLEPFGFPLLLRFRVGVPVHEAVLHAVMRQTATWMRPCDASQQAPAQLHSSFGSTSFGEESRLLFGF